MLAITTAITTTINIPIKPFIHLPPTRNLALDAFLGVLLPLPIGVFVKENESNQKERKMTKIEKF